MRPSAKWLTGGNLNIGLEPIVNFNLLNWRKQQRTEAGQLVIDSYGFFIWNNTLPTCYHMGYESINDYTLSLGIEVQGWNVVHTPTMDDHQYIEFQVSVDEVNIKAMVQQTTDSDKYNERLLENIDLLPYDDVGSTRENAVSYTHLTLPTIYSV